MAGLQATAGGAGSSEDRLEFSTNDFIPADADAVRAVEQHEAQLRQALTHGDWHLVPPAASA